MKRKISTTDLIKRKLIYALIKQGKKESAPIWIKIAEELSKRRRNKVEVNLGKINKYSRDGETIVVPGKVLANGEIDKSITLVAYKFSDSALEKITEKKIKTMTFEELMKKNPKGSNVRIII